MGLVSLWLGATAFIVQPAPPCVPGKSAASCRMPAIAATRLSARASSRAGLSMALKTVGDTKAAFQGAYGRPVGTFFQGFVGEMLSSITLAMIAPTYKYSRIFALGFETLCDTFIADQLSESEKELLVSSMCVGLDLDRDTLKTDAQALRDAASPASEDELLASTDFKQIAELEGAFKYSYAFGAGMLALMPLVDATPTEETLGR